IDITCVGVMAPAVAHVKATIPRDAKGESIGSPLDFRYEWDFGDPAGQYNKLPGWNAAHIYDRPGKYTVTLTVRGPGGKTYTRSTWVRVAPDSRARVHVSADGNDAFDGSTPQRAVRSPGRAMQLAKGEAYVLFRRGDTFDISGSFGVHGQGLRLGAYPRGSAPETSPVLRKVPGPPRSESMFVIGAKAADVMAENLTFDSSWDLKNPEFGSKKIPARAFTVGGTNFAARWCLFRNLTDAMNTEMKPTGVMVQGCIFTDEIRGYGVYCNGQDFAIVGNLMGQSRQEHMIRATEPGVTRILVAYNDLRRTNMIKGSLELRMASWFTVACNYFNGGTCRIGPQEQDKGQYPNWKEIKCEWGVVQDNRLDDLFINVRLGTNHMIVRNNVIRLNKDAKEFDWAIILACEKPGYDDVRKVADVRVEDNTVINLGTRGKMLLVQGKPVGITVKRNVYVAPHVTDENASGVQLTAGDATGVQAIEGNVWPAGRGGVPRFGKNAVDPAKWQDGNVVKNERFGAVPFDEDDNVPIATGAGALLGNDRRQREKK
ncbi:MAG TPA: PKD domain-containing protein, partial [Humisphaera sp.]